MRLLQVFASFLVLAILAGPLQAKNATSGATIVQQAAVPAEVQALLDDKRPAAKLSKRELAKRIKAARALIRTGGLSQDVTRKLRLMMKADKQAKGERQTASITGQARGGKAGVAQEPAAGGDQTSTSEDDDDAQSATALPVSTSDLKNPIIVPAGEPEVVFDYAQFKCIETKPDGTQKEDGNDSPDTSASAYRRDDGQVVLLASNSQNFELVGPTLETVKRTGDGGDCKHLIKSNFNPDPAGFEGKQWLSGVFKTPSGERLGFVHNEYHGEFYDKSNACNRGRAGSAHKCWMGSALMLVSTDGGVTFHKSEKYSNLLATAPVTYRQGIGRVGYNSPRVVRGLNTTDKAIAVFVSAVSNNPEIKTTIEARSATGKHKNRKQKNASCLFVGAGSDATQWRGWDGAEFSVTTINPYVAPESGGKRYCQPVVNFVIKSVKYIPSRSIYLAVGHRPSAGRGTVDVVYAISKDLTSWSTPAVLLKTESPHTWKPGDSETPTSYYSLLDPSSSSVNFDTLEDRPYLYFTRYTIADDKIVGKRRLLERVPLKINW